MRTYTVLLSVLVIVLLIAPLPSVQAQTVPPLAQPGPYAVGQRTMTFVDASRNGRKLTTSIWYPGIVPQDKQQQLAKTAMGWPDAVADTKGAPYPLILYSHGHGSFRTEFTPLMYQLASHGFVVAAMTHPGDIDDVPLEYVDRPLDMLFVLDQLATLTKGDLTGLINGKQVGVTGYSEGGHTALALTGAQIDPVHWAAWCAKYSTVHSPSVRAHVCPSQQDIAAIIAYRKQFNPPLKAGERWSPFTDPRIQAALSLTGGGSHIFGEQGLAAATVPTLLLAGTADKDMPYEWDAAFVYQHLGSKDRYLLSLVGADHYFGTVPNLKPIILHFATAFFGYYLQGKQDYAQYLTTKYVDSLEAQSKLGLVWGPYQKP